MALVAAPGKEVITALFFRYIFTISLPLDRNLIRTRVYGTFPFPYFRISVVCGSGFGSSILSKSGSRVLMVKKWRKNTFQYSRKFFLIFFLQKLQFTYP